MLIKNWWKLVSVILIVFSLYGGLKTPLKVAITNVEPVNDFATKNVSLQFFVYNPGAKPKVNSLLFRSKFTEISASNVTLLPNGKGTCTILIPDSLEELATQFTAYANINGIWSSLQSALILKTKNKAKLKTNFELNKLPNLPSNGSFPFLLVLYETVRNLVFHVPLWFSMMVLLFISFFYAIKYMVKGNIKDDYKSHAFIKVAVLCGALGCITGAIWARVTWGGWWPAEDPKLQGVAIGMFLYFAYLLLRSTVTDTFQKAKLASVYAIFIFPIFIALIAIMPKLSPISLHPGTGGSVGFNNYDLNNTLRMYFYPACLGWILFYTWLAQLTYKTDEYTRKKQLED